MDFAVLEKSAHVAPLLVRLYDNQRQYLQGAQTQLIYDDLTDAVAELVSSSLSHQEQELVTDVVLALLRQAKLDLREALAERLSLMEEAPIRLILKLAHDDIPVASKVLKKSAVLNDLDLLYIIKAKDADYWREIAKRDRMGEAVIITLAEQKDLQTAQALAENGNIQMPLRAYSSLTEMAQFSEVLARPLLSRSDVPENVARLLYQHVGGELRTYIASRFSGMEETVSEAINDVLVEFGNEQKSDSYLPTTSMLKAALALEERGTLSAAQMIKTLRRGQIASFVALLSIKAHLEPAVALSTLEQHSGRGLAVTCRALKFTKAEFMQSYLLTQRVRSENGFVDQVRFSKALEYFDELTLPTALAILKNSQHGTA